MPRQPTGIPEGLSPSCATELVAAVELMTTAVFKPDPGVTIAVPFGIEHVGGTSGLTVPLYVTKQLRLTVPTKPNWLVTETGSVLEPSPATKEYACEDTCKVYVAGCGTTVRVTGRFVVAGAQTESPAKVAVIEYVPGVENTL
jgi:hypothetical protein